MTRLFLVAATVFAGACASRDAPPAPAPPSNVPEMATTSDESPTGFDCGGATCATGEMCESRFKGHDVDDEGRPLDRTKCVPLPAPCQTAPTCACVAAHVSATHCTDDGGHVRIDDFPR